MCMLFCWETFDSSASSRCESIYLSWQTGRATEVYRDVCVRVLHDVGKYRCPTRAGQQTDLETIEEVKS
jgi:hypothetical protein